MGSLIFAHPHIRCCYCLTTINRSEQSVKQIDKCPYCNKTLSTALLNLFTLCRVGIEHDKIYNISITDEELRAKIYGSHFRLEHGWEPYGEFIITAVVSGVIGNLAYDVIKKMVNHLFTREYSEVKSGFNVENHVTIVLKTFRDRRHVELRAQFRQWIDLAQANHSGEYRVILPSDEEIDELLSALQQGLDQVILPDLDGESSKNSNKVVLEKRKNLANLTASDENQLLADLLGLIER